MTLATTLLTDVAHASHARRKGRPITDPAPDMAPNLAIEVLSLSNTIREMEKKRGDCFSSGVRLVWSFDPSNRTAAVYTSADDAHILAVCNTVDGGDVLPSFSVTIKINLR